MQDATIYGILQQMAKPISLEDLRRANPRMAAMVDKAMGVATPQPAALQRGPSKLEIRFSQQLAGDTIPPHQRNYFFLPDRDLELDFAWPQWKVGVEIQGGVHKMKLSRDCEKMVLAILAGWVILPLDRKLVTSGQGLQALSSILAKRQS